MLQKLNFGLNGFRNDLPDAYDNLFGLGKEAREKRKEKKEDKRQKREDNKNRSQARKDERQEKRELGTEKKRIKNEMKQVQVEEKKAQLALLNQQGSQGPPPDAPKSDNTMMLVAAGVAVVFIGAVGYMMLKNKPSPAIAA